MAWRKVTNEMNDEMEYPPGHDKVREKVECPKCGSKDNLVRYEDGHAKCFSPGCGHFEKSDGWSGSDHPTGQGNRPAGPGGTPSGLLAPDGPKSYEGLKGVRKLHSDTLRAFGYFTATYSGKGVHVAPYLNQTGNVVEQKLRFGDKTFTVLKTPGAPPVQDCQLFGQHLWGGRDKRIVVVEGEIDAMSVYQAMGGKQPVVSIGGGAASAKKHMQKNLLWLMKFEEVILFFDNDEAGNKAVEECVQIFGPGSVKIARMESFKDASEALQANRPGDITAAIYGASAWAPAGILSAKDVLSRVDFDAPPPKRFSTPWPHFTSQLYGGISKEDVIFILSGSGKGKSTFLFELISHLEEKEKATVGALFFEDTLTDVVHGLLTVRTSQRLRLDPSLVSSAVKREEWDKISASDRLYLFDGENATWGMDNLINYIRFLVLGCNCDFVLVDPLSFLIAQSDEKDERKAIDRIVATLAVLAKQLHVGIIITHHLTRPDGDKGHEEGADISLKQARGSNGIGQFCTLALGLRWNAESEVTELKCLKSRKQGELSGKVLSWLRYVPETGRVVETAEPSESNFNATDRSSDGDGDF